MRILPKPEPCPWCGQDPDVFGASIMCINAECPVEPSMINKHETLPEALAAWNSRKFFKVTVF